MTFNIRKRSLIRLVSFAVAFLVVIGTFTYITIGERKTLTSTLQYHYMKSVEDLVTHTKNIESDLMKVLYSSSPTMLSQLSSKIWRETGFAKDIIATLPIDYVKLTNTNKLLSQVGDYCVSLSKRFASGEEITAEQRESLKALLTYCDSMAVEAEVVQDSIRTGSVNLASPKKRLSAQELDTSSPDIAEGFVEFEEGFTSYPTLIYDGPFSDHIMQKEPELLKGQATVDKETARKKAAIAAGVQPSALKDSEDEKSKMESFGFSGDGVTVAVTKKGSLVSYMLKSRDVAETKLNVQHAINQAVKYLASLGIENMQSTYYEITNNVITINFASVQDGVMLYPDLIKVSVAMDNAEIVEFDSRGYIVNHHPREITPPTVNESNAQKKISSFLRVEESGVCIVPSGGLSEVLCYEFKCTADDGKEVLVYINANTMEEEQILLLLTSENGTLTI